MNGYQRSVPFEDGALVERADLLVDDRLRRDRAPPRADRAHLASPRTETLPAPKLQLRER